jgi:ADP-heptose:LPS heptosyltransferase
LLAALRKQWPAQSSYASLLDLSGRTSLGGIGAVLARCELLVCTDPGVSHIAAALDVRSVVLATGSDTSRWAPADKEMHRVLFHSTPCRPCVHDACPTGHECAMGLTVANALVAIEESLAGRSPSLERSGDAFAPAARV